MKRWISLVLALVIVLMPVLNAAPVASAALEMNYDSLAKDVQSQADAYFKSLGTPDATEASLQMVRTAFPETAREWF